MYEGVADDVVTLQNAILDATPSSFGVSERLQMGIEGLSPAEFVGYMLEDLGIFSGMPVSTPTEFDRELEMADPGDHFGLNHNRMESLPRNLYPGEVIAQGAFHYGYADDVQELIDLYVGHTA